MDTKRLTTCIMDAITAAGEFPEGTMRDRVIRHLTDARFAVDDMIGAGPTRKPLDAPMSSRMS